MTEKPEHPESHWHGLFAIPAAVLCFSALPAAAARQEVVFDVGTLLARASGIGLLAWPIVIVCILLLSINAASLAALARSIPVKLAGIAGDYVRKGDYEGLLSLSAANPSRFTRSLSAGLEDRDGEIVLDKAAVLASWQALSESCFLPSRAIRAYAWITISIAALGVGVELVGLYVDVYSRISVVMGELPLRDLLQTGSANVIVLGAGGLAVFTVSLVSGILFSGTAHAMIARRTSLIVDLLSEAGMARMEAGGQ